MKMKKKTKPCPKCGTDMQYVEPCHECGRPFSYWICYNNQGHDNKEIYYERD